MNFLDKIKKKAQALGKRIVLPESSDERVLQAAGKLQKEGLCEAILVGEPATLHEKAQPLTIDLSNIEIVKIEKHLDEFENAYFDLVRKPGISREEVRRQLNNPLYFGAMLVQTGYADGVVSGSLATTAEVLRAAIKAIGLQENISLVSSVFLMISP
ncbi:MAG: phosphate acyltransferase, partial [bacterium]